MKTHSLLFLTGVAAAVFSPVMRAQAPAAAPSQTLAVNANSPEQAPNQIVYTPRLPSAAELTSSASAQGLTVEKITESGNQVLAVYRMANGQTNTVSYQVLPPAGANNQGIAVPSTPAPNVNGVVAAPSNSTTVVYTSPAPTYYYYPDSYGWGYGYGYGWYPPVSLHVGLGYYHGFGGYRGGYHGGFHGGFHGGRVGFRR